MSILSEQATASDSEISLIFFATHISATQLFGNQQMAATARARVKDNIVCNGVIQNELLEKSMIFFGWMLTAPAIGVSEYRIFTMGIEYFFARMLEPYRKLNTA